MAVSNSTSAAPSATCSPAGVAEGLDGAGGGGGDGVFHFHRFQNQQRRAFVDLLAGLGEQGDDLAGHRGSQAAAVGAAGFDQVQRVVAQQDVGSAMQKDVSFVVDRDNAGDQPAVVEFDGN
jgi:hypothetical protein